MGLEVVWAGSREAVLQATGEGAGRFELASPARLVVDGVPQDPVTRTVFYVDGLEPGSEHRVMVDGPAGACSVAFATKPESAVLDVHAFGARGDGVHDDTPAIQAAVAVCPAQGRVLLPAGDYAVTALFLKSAMTLELAAGAALRPCHDRDRVPVLPAGPDLAPGLALGAWEGEDMPMFAAGLTGLRCSDLVVCGRGLVDGGATADEDNWWFEPKRIRVAARPRLLFLSQCDRVTVAGLSFDNSPSWNLHPRLCRDLDLLCLTVNGPKDSPNTDGLDPESCSGVHVAGCDFNVGDDCIAIKSGKATVPRELRPPCEDVLIEHCSMHDGHGAVVVGSEIAGGVRRVTARECVFQRTDRGLRVKTRRGRGKDSVVENVTFERLAMDRVLTPFVINSFYFCDPDGQSDYVQRREALPVDDRTPCVASVTFRDITATNAECCASHISGLPEQPIDRLTFEHVSVSFADDAEPSVPAMACGVPKLCRSGLNVSYVGELALDDVRLCGVDGAPVAAEGVGSILGSVTVLDPGRTAPAPASQSDGSRRADRPAASFIDEQPGTGVCAS